MSEQTRALLKPGEAKETEVFSTGTGNVVMPDGNVVRDVGRDLFNQTLSSLGVAVYDTQVHPDTLPG